MRMRRGNYASLTGLSVVVLLGFAALSIDIARLHTAKAQIQSNTDAAVLAALVVYRNEVGDVSNPEAAAQAAAQYVFDQNVVADDYGKVDMNFQMGIFDWDAADGDRLNSFAAGAGSSGERNAVQIVGTRRQGSRTTSVNTLLAPIFGGPDQVDVGAEAVGSFRYRDILVLTDITTSLRTPEIADVQRANSIFLETLEDIRVPGDQIGLITYTGEARVVSELQMIRDSASFEHWFDGVANCSLTADHYYYYYYAEVEEGESANHRWTIFPHQWSRVLQGVGNFDFEHMLDGADDMLFGDMAGLAEIRFWNKYNGGTGGAFASKNDSLGGLMPPCNYGRDSGQFYGENGYWMSNASGSSRNKWYGDGNPNNTMNIRTGTEYLGWSGAGQPAQHPIYPYFQESGTNQVSALWKAGEEFQSPRARQSSVKVMVLISDGLPEAGSPGSGTLEDKSIWLEDLARNAAAQYCAQGISIFTVSYNTPETAWAMARQSTFMRDLAEDPFGSGEPCNYGRFYETPDSSDLPDIMEEIARKLPIQIVK